MTTRCEFCGAELPTKNAVILGRQVTVTMPCDCKQAVQAYAEERCKAEAEERRTAFAEVWARGGVPERFQHVKADFAMAQAVIGGRSLYLHGKNGRGKTHMACQIAKAFLVKSTYREYNMMRCWKSFRFVTAQDLLSKIRTSWDRWDENEEDVFWRYAGVDLLVLDDLGKGVPSEWAAENLNRIIDARWSKQRPVIITSQYSMPELAGRYAKAGDETMSAMLSRLGEEWCDSILVEGVDRRMQRSH